MNFKHLLIKPVSIFCLASFFAINCSVAFALNDEEIACNKSLDAADGKKALLQAEKLLKQNPNNTAALLCQGRAFHLIGNSEAAIKSYTLAETTTKDLYDQAVATILAGNIYKRMQQYPEALARYNQGLVYAQKAKNNALMLAAYLGSADVYAAKNDASLALENYQNAYSYGANDNERGETLEKVAAAHAVLKQYEQAVEQELKAYIMLERSGTLDQFASASVTLGRYYLLNKDYAASEKILNKIIKFAQENGGPFYEAQGSYVLAQVKAAQNDKASAKTLVESALAIAKITQDKELEAEIVRETNSLF